MISTAYQTLQNPHQRLKIYLDWGLVREGGFHNAFIEERATARGREMRELLVQDFGYQGKRKSICCRRYYGTTY